MRRRSTCSLPVRTAVWPYKSGLCLFITRVRRCAMEMPSRLQQWLDNANAQFELVPHTVGRSFAELASELAIPPEAIVRVVPLSDSQGRLAALVPANYLLDFEALQAL